MKLNSVTEMEAVTWPEFSALHPFAPADQTRGSRELIEQLSEWLVTITGYDAVSLQPNAGSQGEFAGLLAIRNYHDSRGDQDRKICLIPSSAHGTNAASAVGLGSPSAQVSFLASATKIPEATLGQVEASYMGRKVKYAGDREFPDWTLSCYNDGNYSLRKAFETWSNLINSYEGNVGPNNLNAYLTDWYVQPLTREGNVIATYKFVGCWPKTLSSIDLAFESKTDLSKFDVTMAYQYHSLEGITT